MTARDDDPPCGPTGRFRFRTNFFGKLILEIEDGMFAMWPHSRDVTYGTLWRDARAADLTHPKLRRLLPKAKP